MGGPFEFAEAFSQSAVEVRDPKTGHTFKVNGQRLKPYTEGIGNGDMIKSIALMDPFYYD